MKTKNSKNFDPDQHIIIERCQYEILVARLEHLEHGTAKKKRRGFWAFLLQRPTVGVLAVVLAGILVAGATKVGVFFDGNRYLSLGPPERMGYICGVSDAYMCAAKVYKIPELNSFCKCIQGGVTPVQVHAVLEKYLKEHPERLNYAMADIIYDIVNDSFINTPHK